MNNSGIGVNLLIENDIYDSYLDKMNTAALSKDVPAGESVKILIPDCVDSWEEMVSITCSTRVTFTFGDGKKLVCTRDGENVQDYFHSSCSEELISKNDRKYPIRTYTISKALYEMAE